MKFSVELARRADRDVGEISEWIADRSPKGALRWLEAFDAARVRLAAAAASFSRADEADALGEDIRQIFFRTPKGREYRAVFRIEETRVLILCVRGPGQAPIAANDIY